MAIALTNSSSNPQQNGTLDGAPGVGDNKQDIDVNRLKQCGTPRYLSPELLEGPMDVHNFADAFRQGKISPNMISIKGNSFLSLYFSRRIFNEFSSLGTIQSLFRF